MFEYLSLFALQVGKNMDLLHPSMYRSQTIEVWMIEATLFSWQAMWLHIYIANEHRVYTSHASVYTKL